MEKFNGTMSSVTYWLVVACAFLLPWNFIIAPVGILLVLSWLLTFDYKAKWENMRSHSVLWLFLALMVLYIAGYFWSENKSEALTSLEVKASILFFPLVFASLRYDYKRTKLILQGFLAGLICVGTFMIIRSVFTNADPTVDVWSYQELSRDIMHPSYLSLYYVAGIMVCFHGILLRDVPVARKALAVAFVLFFCIMIFMLTSKTGIISLLLIFLFYIGYAVVRFKRYVVAGAGLVALVIGFFMALQLFPSLKERLSNMTEVLSSDTPINPAEVESNRVRLLIWQQNIQIMSAHTLAGVGTGDVQDALMKKYEEAGMTGAYEKRLNAHSQFFQTGIALGLPGMVILFGIFLAAFTIAVRRRYGFAALLTVLLAFNFIPESMLQLQAGTFFFGFFFSFILFTADTAVISPKGSKF
jgi:O-antigen ligase